MSLKAYFSGHNTHRCGWFNNSLQQILIGGRYCAKCPGGSGVTAYLVNVCWAPTTMLSAGVTDGTKWTDRRCLFPPGNYALMRKDGISKAMTVERAEQGVVLWGTHPGAYDGRSHLLRQLWAGLGPADLGRAWLQPISSVQLCSLHVSLAWDSRWPGACCSRGRDRREECKPSISVILQMSILSV